MIEVIEDENFFVLKSDTSSLWCSKLDGSLTVHPPAEIIRSTNPECIGVVDALIGKFRTHSEASWKLLMVGRSEVVGQLPPTMQDCYKVTNLVTITLAPHHPSNQVLSLKTCPKHGGGKVASDAQKPLRRTWNQFVNAAESIRPKKLNFRLPLGNNSSHTTNTNNINVTNSPHLTSSSLLMRDIKDKDKYERRVMEELQLMFEESNSFYFTPQPGDLTNCTQALQTKLHPPRQPHKPATTTDAINLNSNGSREDSISAATTPSTAPTPLTPSTTSPHEEDSLTDTLPFTATHTTATTTNTCATATDPTTEEVYTTTTITPTDLVTTLSTCYVASSHNEVTDTTSSSLSSTTATHETTATTTTNAAIPFSAMITETIDLTATSATPNITTATSTTPNITTATSTKTDTPTTATPTTATTTIATPTTTTLTTTATPTTATPTTATPTTATPTTATPTTATPTTDTSTTATPITATPTKATTATPTTTTPTTATPTTATPTTATSTTATPTTATPTTATSSTATSTTATPTTATSTTATPITPSWRTADDRYFWNKHMISELIEVAENNMLADEWITPLLHGFVQMQECPIRFDDDDSVSGDDLKVKLCIVSRRSRYRAGTRYKRRGVDEQGYTANFVETEQIVEFVGHVVSYIQVRGSLPLFWSQSGLKYKPPPKIERDFDENHGSFCKHLLMLLDLYDKVNIVNLIDQGGKERQVGEAYLQHIVTMNHPCLNYASFDFHEYCRGMRFENISILTESLMEQVQEMKYCWVDPGGMICQQKGVFRVNCIDCLDRTNIVQSALARVVLEMQCRKLGLLSPERQLPTTYRTAFQAMWANNGDVISRQYAGTAALKGDYTRTGERKLAGVMRDGVNSANRYYINRVRDVFRQACYDFMQGYHHTNHQPTNEIDGGVDEGVVQDEDIKSVVEDCSRMIINQPEIYIGGWGLVNADRLGGMTSEGSIVDVSNALEMDSILFLSDTSVYIADYDDDTDAMTRYKKISLSDVTYIEIGLLTLSSKLHQMCMRMHYSHEAIKNTEYEPLFYSWLVPGTRLSYSGGVSGGRSIEEARESLFTLVGSVVNACKNKGLRLSVDERKISSEEHSGKHEGVVVISQQAHIEVEHNMAEPPSNISGIPTPNLPFPQNQANDFPSNQEAQNTLNTEGKTFSNSTTDHDIPRFYNDHQENHDHDFQADSNHFSTSIPHDSHLSTFMQNHVQQTRHLQALLKGLVNSRISLPDHCVTPSCGLIMTRSLSQVGMVENRKDEDEDVRFESEKSSDVKGDGEIGMGGVLVGERSVQKHVMLENKSKSLDASAMLAKMKKETIQAPNIASSIHPSIPETSTKLPTTALPIKSSHSDYEIISKASSFDFLQEPANSNSTFVRLKRKVAQLTPSSLHASLAVPNLFNPSPNNHQALRNSAKSKLMTSQMRFQHLNSKVILL